MLNHLLRRLRLPRYADVVATRNASARRRSKALSPELLAIHRSQAVIEFGLDGLIITANENFLRVMGYPLTEVVGRHHSMFVHPDEAGSADYG